jgi:hypothetical protein
MEFRYNTECSILTCTGYSQMKMIDVSVKYGDYAVVRFHDNYIALKETDKERN